MSKRLTKIYTSSPFQNVVPPSGSVLEWEQVVSGAVTTYVKDSTGAVVVRSSSQHDITVIPAATSAYTLSEGHFSHAPSSAPIYTLPAVTDSTRTHEIILTVRFSASAMSIAFQNSAGSSIVPLPVAGTIMEGSVVCYRCTWEGLLNSWAIMPIILGTYSAGA